VFIQIETLSIFQGGFFLFFCLQYVIVVVLNVSCIYFFSPHTLSDLSVEQETTNLAN